MQQVAIAWTTRSKVEDANKFFVLFSLFYVFRKVKRWGGKKIHGRTVFMAVLFVASVFVLGIKLLNPTPVQIFIEGRDTAITQIPGFFTFSDVIILVVASITLAISGTYLLFL